MVNIMNVGHSSMAKWGFKHIEIADDDVCLDVGCGGRFKCKAAVEKMPLRQSNRH